MKNSDEMVTGMHSHVQWTCWKFDTYSDSTQIQRAKAPSQACTVTEQLLFHALRRIYRRWYATLNRLAVITCQEPGELCSNLGARAVGLDSKTHSVRSLHSSYHACCTCIDNLEIGTSQSSRTRLSLKNNLEREAW